MTSKHKRNRARPSETPRALDRTPQQTMHLAGLAAVFAALSCVISGAALWNVRNARSDPSNGQPTKNKHDDADASNVAPYLAGTASLTPTMSQGPGPVRDSSSSAETSLHEAVPLPSEIESPHALGQSVGFPRSGSLFEGKQFPPGEGYTVRNPERSWATAETVRHVQNAIARVRKQNPNAANLLIGDLSFRTGGQISGHRSHHSGRDIDIGFFHRVGTDARSSSTAGDRDSTHEEAYEDEYEEPEVDTNKRRRMRKKILFRRATRRNLQIPILLEFIIALADSRNEPGGVDWIMMDYRIQEWLVEYAERSGYDSRILDKVFQVPHGPSAPSGIVRHYPGHLDHMHVRFKCPPTDRYCASPKLGPAAMQAP